MHETTRKSAEDVCDGKIVEWLMNRKKHVLRQGGNALAVQLLLLLGSQN